MGYLAKRKAEKRHKIITFFLLIVLTLVSFADAFCFDCWRIDFVVQFRLQYAIVLFILAITSIPARMWGCMAYALFLLVINLSFITAHVNLFDSDVAPSDKTLKIMVFNTKAVNNKEDEILDTIRKEKADFVYLMETPRRRIRELSKLRPPYRYSHEYIDSKSPVFSSVILSKTRFKEIGVIDSGELPGAIWVKVKHNRENIILLGVHLKHFYSEEGHKEVKEQIKAYVDFINKRDEPVILMGDFNAAPWTSFLYPLQTKANMKVKGGVMPSWNSVMPWFLRIPLDFVYTHRGFDAIDTYFADSSGSDHLPLVINFVMKK